MNHRYCETHVRMMDQDILFHIITQTNTNQASCLSACVCGDACVQEEIPVVIHMYRRLCTHTGRHAL
jgi:hypothetical protein